MGGANTQPTQMSQMMKKETMQEFTNPDGSKTTYGGDVPYYDDTKPMVVPSNYKEPLRNVEYIKAEANVPLTDRDISNIQNEGQQLMEASILAANQDVGFASPNATGRDSSVSEYMKAKTYKKPKGKALTAPTADYPDER